MYRTCKLRITGQERTQTHGVWQTEMVMKMRVAKIGINQEDFFAKLSKGICQVGHQCGFAIAKGGATDLDDFPVLRKVAKKRLRP